MTLPDLVNGSLELGGGIVQIGNLIRLWRDRRVAGVDWRTFIFFGVWGWWNLFYYPHLGQTLSFYGGILIVASNTSWVISYLIITRQKGLQCAK